MENIEEIKKDPILSEKIKYIVIDDGWEHMPGEWKLNYRVVKYPQKFYYEPGVIKKQLIHGCFHSIFIILL
ncbi:MAG TPA: hypothetical protein GXX20_05125 [Clostridiaceae bacterium]|nr:hypothetical protein [Clostridiaceae bacterium]